MLGRCDKRIGSDLGKARSVGLRRVHPSTLTYPSVVQPYRGGADPETPPKRVAGACPLYGVFGPISPASGAIEGVKSTRLVGQLAQCAANLILDVLGSLRP